MEIKRLFFAFQVEAPWPDLPEGKKIAENVRHMTLVFLGNVDYEKFLSHLKTIPLPPIKMGATGYFIHSHFLPPRHPHVVAWEASFLQKEMIVHYVNELMNWLKNLNMPLTPYREWLPHVTLTRKPFHSRLWQSAFKKIPFKFDTMHLYESYPNLDYRPLWSYCMIKPFEPIEHMADIGYLVRGETIEQLFENAFHALCFSFPDLIKYKPKTPTKAEEIIPALNLAIAHADSDIGCPFKAVSHHGKIEKKENHYEWEMIVDV